MSFIDTPAASPSSAPANSRLQGKRPAIPCYAQTLSTFKAIDLFANDETAQKICSYFEDPDTVFAIDKLVKILPPASTPSRSAIPTPTLRRSQNTMTRQRSSSTASSFATNRSTSVTSVMCYQWGEPGHIRPRCPKFKCSYCYQYTPGHSFRDCSYNPENEQHTDPYYGGIDEDLLDDAGIANTTGEPYRDY
ncbi:hypothetical protein CVT25_000715 [Psilocybe cyanescens]|uniref:CCHC-type domain-containing protein n=1 Tax=Psilocybe cyanescens TaxID=93625 RepID=A0A409XYE1_PSICY|nr:hypothetical protein CVT25_000715 [Psilocybe cyanescens]